MGREQKFKIYDHKVMDCPKDPEKHVYAWLGDNRSVLLTVDPLVEPSEENITGSAMIPASLFNFNRPFQCPGCRGNGCDVVLEDATNPREIVRSFRSIKIVPVPVEALSPV